MPLTAAAAPTNHLTLLGLLGLLTQHFDQLLLALQTLTT
jgi:hypothetical protein